MHLLSGPTVCHSEQGELLKDDRPTSAARRQVVQHGFSDPWRLTVIMLEYSDHARG